MADLNTFDDRTTQDLLTLVRMLRAGMIGTVETARRPAIDGTAEPIFFTNDSGEEIPAYACMQVTGTEEIGGQNYLVVDKPADTDGTAGGYIFNGPRAVADDAEGVAQVEQVVRAYKNTGTVTGGEKWSPVVNQWYIAQVDGGPFICCGADDVDDDVLKVFAQGVGAGSSDSKIVQTPGGGIAARSGTTVGSASCTEFKIDSGTTLATNTNTITVKNIWPFAIPASMYIKAHLESISGEWIAEHPGVIDVQWDDPDLEQTLDGSTYTNIDTAEDCS